MSTGTISTYHRPGALNEALDILRTQSGAPWSILAGGTDFYPARVGHPADLRGERILDISAIVGLRNITQTNTEIRLGATTTWRDIIGAMREERLPAYFSGLVAASREVGGQQIQTAGTLGGNLCNASPAADGVPALLALDAQVELARLVGDAVETRRIALQDFILGNRRTTRAADELLTAIIVPQRPISSRAVFLKLGHRKYLVISIAMVAVTVDFADDGRITAARVAVGACGPVARRLNALEAAVVGEYPHEVAHLITPDHLAPLSPIDDVRGTAAYRLDAVKTLIGRAFQDISQ